MKKQTKIDTLSIADIKRTVKVRATRDYDKFKRIIGNRPVKIPHVNALIKSIAGNNLLYGFVGVVTKDDYIIDGQHRLEAAKANNLWFYYIKIEEKIDDIIVALVNSSHLAWRPDDYVNFYAERGNEQYIFLKEEHNESGVSVANLVSLWRNKGNRLKKGELSLFSNDEEKKLLIEMLEAFLSLKDTISTKVFLDREFVVACRVMFQQVSSSDIIEAINKGHLEVTPQTVTKDYLRIFEALFNRYRHEKNQIRFF